MTANTSAIWQHAALTTDQRKLLQVFWKEFRRMDQQTEKRSDRKSNKTRQKNKRGDSTVESNDSHEIPDREETSRHPQPPFRG